MFPLRGEAVVFGDDCPAVGQLTDCGFAGIDHWLDRENHVGFQLGPGASLSIMNYLWVFMKFCSDPSGHRIRAQPSSRISAGL